MGNWSDVKNVTSENFILKLCTHDYFGEIIHHANFGFIRHSEASPLHYITLHNFMVPQISEI